jgi:hypothetical protein
MDDDFAAMMGFGSFGKKAAPKKVLNTEKIEQTRREPVVRPLPLSTPRNRSTAAAGVDLYNFSFLSPRNQLLNLRNPRRTRTSSHHNLLRPPLPPFLNLLNRQPRRQLRSRRRIPCQKTKKTIQMTGSTTRISRLRTSCRYRTRFLGRITQRCLSALHPHLQHIVFSSFSIEEQPMLTLNP